jgi:DNA-binding LacI/PurR family transcriptional regulator
MLKERTRSYQNRETTGIKFDELLVDMRKRGDLILPSERELTEALECSRETVRRVLENKENEGVVIRKGRRRALSMDALSNADSVGRFAFVAYGTNMVGNPAWNKLWNALQLKSEAAGLSAELILVPNKLDDREIKDLFRDRPEVIIMTTLDYDNVREFVFRDMSKHLICTEEQYAGKVPVLITPDSLESGRMAARKLFEYGYRKPAMIHHDLISCGKPYVFYTKRYRGFKEECKKYDMEFDENSEFRIVGHNYKLIVQHIKAASKIAGGKFDSVFLHTDDALPFFYEALNEEKRIPDEIGLLTVNSQDKALNHTPRVSSISHCTLPMADTILRKIKNFYTNGTFEHERIFVKPEFLEGETLK